MNESVSLETLIVTSELDERPTRPPDYHAENRALVALMKSLDSPTPDTLQQLAETALTLCRAESAGISIAEEVDGVEVFRWHASAGRWAPYLNGTIPRHASPCGVVLERNAALLMQFPERHFDYPLEGAPPLAETLLVPFDVAGKAVGTLWIIIHDGTHRFDREDLRLMRCLGEFASVAFQVIQQKQLTDALERERAASHLLQSISVGLIPDGDIDAFYRQIMDAAMAIMHADFASMQMLDANGDLQLIAWSGFHPDSARFWQTIHVDSITSCGRSLRGRGRFVISDTEREASIAGSEDLDHYRLSGIRAMQSTPLMSREGKLVGVVSTHWREAHVPSENELRSFDVLARETADLIERAKVEAALREADRRKDEFLAVLGHELRNPLAPISTGIELLQRAGHEPELATSIHAMMKRQLTHLVRLVDDLLDLSRISRGKVELQQTPLDLRVVIEAAVELARPIVQQREHRLVVEHGGSALPVVGDLERLTQVVANVLNNAAKYSDPGGLIRLGCAVEGDEVVVRMRDSGFGIPSDRLDAIFEMFSQVPEHRARRGGGGLGIGLALSRSLVELHGGSLVATSDGPGHGSEFVLRLPRGDAAAIAHDDAPQAAALPAMSRRILIVDDNVDAATSLRAALEWSGHTVEVAHDGPASLGLLQGFAPAVVLLDIGLPHMDGYEVARRVRSLANGANLLLVAITGWGQAIDRARAREAGFDVHMTKPVGLAALEAALVRGPNLRD